MWGVNAINGTFFVYGDAGPPKGYALYDSANQRVFYEQGCCSQHEIVLASTASAPPMHLKSADLRNVHTTRGAALGMTIQQIRSRYGYAKLLTSRRPDIAELSYKRTAQHPKPGEPCEQDDDFVFQNGKVVLISIAEAC